MNPKDLLDRKKAKAAIEAAIGTAPPPDVRYALAVKYLERRLEANRAYGNVGIGSATILATIAAVFATDHNWGAFAGYLFGALVLLGLTILAFRRALGAHTRLTTLEVGAAMRELEQSIAVAPAATDRSEEPATAQTPAHPAATLPPATPHRLDTASGSRG